VSRLAFGDERFEPGLEGSDGPRGDPLRWVDAGTHFIGREAAVRIPLPEPLEVALVVGVDISHHVDFLDALRALVLATLIIRSLEQSVARVEACCGGLPANLGGSRRR
jgi:hypothetical protein